MTREYALIVNTRDCFGCNACEVPASRSTICPLAQDGFESTLMVLVKLKASPR